MMELREAIEVRAEGWRERLALVGGCCWMGVGCDSDVPDGSADAAGASSVCLMA